MLHSGIRLTLCFVGFWLDLCFGLLIDILSYFDTHHINLDIVHPNRNSEAILFIHGSGSNQLQCIIGRNILKHHFSIYSLNLVGDCTIDEYAEQVRIRLASLPPAIHLIGISMGGLVAARVALTRPALTQPVLSVTTICTPFFGAPILLLFTPQRLQSWGYCPKRWVDLDPKSQFLQQLHHDLPRLACPLWTFGSTADLLIPNEFTKPNQSKEHVIYSFPGHLSMSYMPSIYHIIRDRLESAPPHFKG